MNNERFNTFANDGYGNNNNNIDTTNNYILKGNEGLKN